MKVKVKQYNICHNGTVYRVGDVFDISPKEYSGFLKKYCEEVVEKRTEPTRETEIRERVKKQ